MFAWAVAKRLYLVVLPPLVLDPFDFLRTVGVNYSPPRWMALALLGIGLYVASSLAYHEIRVKLRNIRDEVGDAVRRLRSVKVRVGKTDMDAARILQELAKEFASGLSSLHLDSVFRQELGIKSTRTRLPLRDFLAELLLENIVRKEQRQAGQANASGIFKSAWAGPHDVYYLTHFGTQVVARLRDPAR